MRVSCEWTNTLLQCGIIVQTSWHHCLKKKSKCMFAMFSCILSIFLIVFKLTYKSIQKHWVCIYKTLSLHVYVCYALFSCPCSLPTTVTYFSCLGQLDPVLFPVTLPFFLPTTCILVFSSISYQVLWYFGYWRHSRIVFFLAAPPPPAALLDWTVLNFNHSRVDIWELIGTMVQIQTRLFKLTDAYLVVVFFFSLRNLHLIFTLKLGWPRTSPHGMRQGNGSCLLNNVTKNGLCIWYFCINTSSCMWFHQSFGYP